jgi:hypothetical protein
MSVLTFIVIFISGTIGTRNATIALQQDTLKDIEFLKQHREK